MDLVGRALADAFDLLQLLGGELAEIGRLRGDGLRRALVGADAKRLRVALVEHGELGEVAQHVEDVLLGVGHGSPSGARPRLANGGERAVQPRRLAVQPGAAEVFDSEEARLFSPSAQRIARSGHDVGLRVERNLMCPTGRA